MSRFENIPYENKPRAIQMLEDINEISVLMIGIRSEKGEMVIKYFINDLLKLKRETVRLNEDVGNMVKKKIDRILCDYLDFIFEVC